MSEKRQLQQESSSSGEDSSSSDSTSSSEKHHHKHKHHEKKEKEHNHHHHHHHHHDKKKHNKHKHEKKKQKTAATTTTTTASSTEQFGRYGILQESDRWNKQAEFFAWLTEVRGIDPDTLRDKREQKELWSIYVEDYNTCTLPDKKYYSIQAWEHEQLTKGLFSSSSSTKDETDLFNRDEENVKKEREERRKQRAFESVARELVDIRENSQKIADMEHQEELRRKQKLLWKTGDVNQAEKIAQRLRPEDPSS